MTEREKMLRGELYDSSDNELEQLRLHARKLAQPANRKCCSYPESKRPFRKGPQRPDR